MKKIIFLTILVFTLTLILPSILFAKGVVGEKAEGKAVWEKLQAKEVSCDKLSDDNFETLGEYFMDKMAGDSHEAMNEMMIRMMGKEGEEQMHIAMGKRMSNCEPDAPMPQNMLVLSGVEGMNSGMVGGGGNSMMGNFGTNPMSWLGWSFGWVFMILFWVLVVVGIIALIVWLIRQIRGEVKTKSSLDILKERYAKGEIDKKEFEERKKDLI